MLSTVDQTSTADQTSATDQKTKADYEIAITLQDGNASPPDPLPEMHVGQTVRYLSAAGEVRILFTGESPFRTDGKTMTNVPGGVILTLLSPGSALPCRCFVTPDGGTEVGWDKDHPRAGGNHKVSKP
jgi:hypothetical protein